MDATMEKEGAAKEPAKAEQGSELKLTKTRPTQGKYQKFAYYQGPQVAVVDPQEAA